MDENKIPYHFESREYQRPFIRAVNDAIKGKSKKRYFYQIWHRRSGKDKVDIADCIPRRLIQDPCLVKSIYPTLVMGRENLWDGIGKDGFRYRDHIPEGLRVGQPNETTMKMSVRTKTNDISLFQIVGSDHPDSLRGGNPKMIVFSEWAEQDPYAWDVVEPILRENDGIAIFNTTPKGDNHARALYEFAKNDPLWHVEILTAEQTGIWSLKQLDEIKNTIIKRFAANGRSEAEAVAYFDQEYLCSFDSPVVGSYYGAAIRIAERDGRIGVVPWNEALPVHTFWDLGMDDSMSIWFMQQYGLQYRFIDYYESSGEGFTHYAQVLQNKGYLYGKHFAPHDIAVRELGTGKSRIETAAKLGIKFEVGPMLGVDDGINATRAVMRQCAWDADKCHRGLNCLKNYRKDWDKINGVFRNKPKHDWASHGADSFRTFAVGFAPQIIRHHSSDPGGVKPFLEGIG